jgi:RNA polymerase sigma-70 factor (ECF subfamily)
VTDDHEIMLAAKNGSIEKMGVLFDKYHRRLFNYFLYATGNREASDDLVQDVFLRMLKYRRSYRKEGAFRVWLFTIARNARTDYYRKRGKRHEPIEKAGDVIDREPTAEEKIEKADDTAILKKALKSLPDDMREVLVLSRFQNLRYREIGQVLKCSENAVKIRVYRAMKELTAIYNTMTGIVP